jgi:hypothetical protein
MILTIFAVFFTAIKIVITVFAFLFRLIECFVLGGIAAYLAMHVAHHILEWTEEKLVVWTGDAKYALHYVYQSSSACMGFVIIGGLTFDATTLCLRVVAAVVAIWLARLYLRTL